MTGAEVHASAGHDGLMNDTGPAAPDSEHLAHRPERLPSGAIVCPGCTLHVERPADMPDYSRVTMRRW